MKKLLHQGMVSVFGALVVVVVRAGGEWNVFGETVAAAQTDDAGIFLYGIEGFWCAMPKKSEESFVYRRERIVQQCLRKCAPSRRDWDRMYCGMPGAACEDCCNVIEFRMFMREAVQQDPTNVLERVVVPLRVFLRQGFIPMDWDSPPADMPLPGLETVDMD